jgi:hypothetical protein
VWIGATITVDLKHRFDGEEWIPLDENWRPEFEFCENGSELSGYIEGRKLLT